MTPIYLHLRPLPTAVGRTPITTGVSSGPRSSGTSLLHGGTARAAERCALKAVTPPAAIEPSLPVGCSDRIARVKADPVYVDVGADGPRAGHGRVERQRQEVPAVGRSPIGRPANGVGVHGETVARAIGIPTSGNERRPDVRPMPLHRQLEDVLIGFQMWKRKSLRNDGKITGDEALEVLPILDAFAAQAGPELVLTMSHVSTCVQGQRGMFSKKAKEGWAASQNRELPENVILFPVERIEAV